MSRIFFGTDGIRGTANTTPMTADIALKVGMAAGSYFINGNHRHKVVIGKDTRLSGYMIEPALTAGFTSVGMDVILVGPMPTPAVAMLTRSLRADLGVMISASHNAYQDNGIKLFDSMGLKLSDEAEEKIEQSIINSEHITLAAPEALGRAKRLDDAPGRYIEFAKRTFSKDKTLNGIKVVLDCANGAAYHLGRTIFWELEADVIAIGIEPNGFNINRECGSTYPQAMCDAVIEYGADIGIALDGDADRLVVCDEKGNLIDGDQLMGMIAAHQHEMGKLQGGGIVATLMSNMGLEAYLNSIDLKLERTQVGDRHVSSYMREHGYNVGGEQSGHMILRDHITTGDGIIAGLQILAMLADSGRPASEVCNVFEPYPQLLTNVHYSTHNPLELSVVQTAISNAEEELGESGRLVIRKSGTEPLIRVMVEGKDEALIQKISQELTEYIEKAANH